MSHNSKYYTKKLTKRDAAGSFKIKELFAVSGAASQQSKIESKRVVTAILDEIIENVVSTCSSHADIDKSGDVTLC